MPRHAPAVCDEKCREHPKTLPHGLAVGLHVREDEAPQRDLSLQRGGKVDDDVAELNRAVATSYARCSLHFFGHRPPPPTYSYLQFKVLGSTRSLEARVECQPLQEVQAI